jgi:hypothetical protein
LVARPKSRPRGERTAEYERVDELPRRWGRSRSPIRLVAAAELLLRGRAWMKAGALERDLNTRELPRSPSGNALVHQELVPKWIVAGFGVAIAWWP